MRLAVVAAFAVVAGAALAAACSDNPLIVGRELASSQEAGPGNGDAGTLEAGIGTSACASAGGTCIFPNVGCSDNPTLPLSAQDCRPPNGIFCCVSPL